MSINDLIATKVHEGKLVPYLPLRGVSNRRAFLSSKVMDEINKPMSAVNAFGASGYVKAALTKWVLGEPIYKGFLKKLAEPPPGIWEIRVTQPMPQFRVFLRFAAKDTIIVSGIYSRGRVDERGSNEWSAAMNECADLWNELFEGHAYFANGTRSTEYVSEACDDFKV